MTHSDAAASLVGLKPGFARAALAAMGPARSAAVLASMTPAAAAAALHALTADELAALLRTMRLEQAAELLLTLPAGLAASALSSKLLSHELSAVLLHAMTTGEIPSSDKYSHLLSDAAKASVAAASSVVVPDWVAESNASAAGHRSGKHHH
jgi:hypothetical protein